MRSGEQIRNLAHNAGFHLCGFARAEPIAPNFLKAWLEAGFDAEMDWLGSRFDERLDVRKLLPSAQTVIALACNYYWPETSRSGIAMYARGRDYHYTLKDRLRLFRRSLENAFEGIETYGSVDHGPVLEKVWAARAGLGYVGRNGCLITERFGSYVVLAALIISDEVDDYAAGPTDDRCASCSLCKSTCPTEAIVDDAVVDARLCLSYQTIENEDRIPSSLRNEMVNVTFGCDICQTVCPLNEVTVQSDARFIPRPAAKLSVIELLTMTKERFVEVAKGTPLMRAQYDGMRRNAAYAIGAAKDVTARRALFSLVNDESAKVAEAARWALEQLGDD